MKKVITTIALLAVGLSVSAQEGAYLKEAMRESLRESLKEKWRPAGRIQENEVAEKSAGTTIHEGRITTSGQSTQEGEVSLAYHPADSSKLVISFMEETSSGLNFPLYYSSNGGQSWSRSSFNSVNILAQDHAGQLIAGGGDPVFAWDKNGRVYFSWIYLTAKQSLDTAFWSLYYAYSDNNGQSWTVPAGNDRYIGTGALNVNDQSLYNIGDGVTDRQWFAVDNSGGPNQGKLYCSFLRFPADSDPLKFGQCVKAKSYNATAFGPATLAYGGQTQFGNVEVAPNGTLHMTFVDLSAPQRVLHVSSTTGSTSFSAPHLISSGNNLFGQNQPHMVHDRENAATNLAVDGNGILHIVWSDFTSSTWQAFYSRSTDGGLTWSIKKDLNSYFTNRKAFMPTVAAHGKNVSISMAAIDNSDSSSYYQIQSTDNGVSWATPQLLSAGQGDYNGYNSGEFFGDYNRSQRSTCVTYAAWSDGRNATGPKMYFTSTNVCNSVAPSGVGELSTINGNVQLEAVYPNPASAQLTLQLNAEKAGKFNVSLLDMSGRKVWSEQTGYQSGKNNVVLSFGRIAAGTYILSIRDNDGSIITRNISIR